MNWNSVIWSSQSAVNIIRHIIQDSNSDGYVAQRINMSMYNWKIIFIFIFVFKFRSGWQSRYCPFNCHGQSSHTTFTRFECNHLRTSYTRRWSDAINGWGNSFVSGEYSWAESNGKNLLWCKTFIISWVRISPYVKFALLLHIIQNRLTFWLFLITFLRKYCC